MLKNTTKSHTCRNFYSFFRTSHTTISSLLPLIWSQFVVSSCFLVHKASTGCFCGLFLFSIQLQLVFSATRVIIVISFEGLEKIKILCIAELYHVVILRFLFYFNLDQRIDIYLRIYTLLCLFYALIKCLACC